MIKYIDKYKKQAIAILIPYGFFELRILVAFLMAVFSSNKIACRYIGEFFFENTTTLFRTLRKDDSSTMHLRALVI